MIDGNDMLQGGSVCLLERKDDSWVTRTKCEGEPVPLSLTLLKAGTVKSVSAGSKQKFKMCFFLQKC